MQVGEKGDLRKDSIMMETFQLTNRLLQSDPEGRRRKLRMRTCGHLPESVGILEWVNNTSGFRYVMQQLYDYLQVKKSDGAHYNSERHRQFKQKWLKFKEC